MNERGPLGALAGVPGIRGALVRAALAALGQTAGGAMLAVGLAQALARIAGLPAGSPAAPLLLATAGVALRAVSGTLGEIPADRDARRVEGRLRSALVTRLAGSPAALAAAGGPGPAAVLATTRLHDLGPALATYLPALTQTLVVPPVVLLVMAPNDLLSAALVAGTLPLVPLFMVLVGRHTQAATADSARALDRIAAHVAELVRGLPVLVGLGRAADQTAALEGLGESYRRRTLATLRIAFLSAFVLELIAMLSVALVAVTVGVRLVDGSLPLAAGLTALLLAPEAFAPLRALGSAHHAAEDATLAAAEARAVLAAEDAPSVVVPSPVDDPRGADVAVRGLAVRYAGRAVPALAPQELAVRPGEFVALRGPSGSGKSTLLAALAGVIGAEADVVGEIGGIPAGGVAYVPQFARTTGATVADELRRHADSRPGADEIVGEAYVVESLARVGATALAGRAPESLSPGELQRVTLARALVRIRRGAGLLLLDEPTAHLDDDAATVVTSVLAALRGILTIVLVTHDPALAALADRAIDLPAPVTADSGAEVPADRQERSAGAAPVESSGGTAAAELTAGIDGTGTRPPRRAAMGRAVAAGALSSAAGIGLTATSGWLIVRAAQMPAVLTLMVAIVGVRFFGQSRAGMRWVERLTAHDSALRLAAATRTRVWGALAAQGLAADRTPGSALARVVGDVALVQDLTVRVRPPILIAGTVTAGTVAALAVLAPVPALAAGAVLFATIALVLLVHRRVDAGAARAEATLRVAALRGTSTLLEGLPDLRAHGLAARAATDATDPAGSHAHAAGRRARAAALGLGLVSIGTGLAALLAALVGAAIGLAGPVVAVVALAPLALAESLAGLVGGLQRRGALADAQARLDAVVRAPLPPDPEDAGQVSTDVRTMATTALTAGWPGGPDVLRDLDARADAGAGWLVVRGPSGSGKSTFLAVLMAALRPRSGRYALDGVPTAQLTGAGIRSRIAWLPQEAHVFDSTIRANLALAAPRGELTGAAGDARMHAALTAAGLGGLMAALPGGLDTRVGSGGTALSGGERRRLAVARALLADRDVVLLDEPTAHLDPPTAEALIRDLRAALAGRVVVCVTHDELAAPGDTVIRPGVTAGVPARG